MVSKASHNSDWVEEAQGNPVPTLVSVFAMVLAVRREKAAERLFLDAVLVGNLTGRATVVFF
jgi:hypothetical protein